MKRIIRPTLALVMLLITAISFNNCTEEDSSLRDRLDKLEESTINSIEGQKASINKTINYLKSLEPSLDAYSKQTVIEVENSLQSFVDNELTGATDWYSATVATLVQYEKAVTQLALLGEYMSGLCAEYGDSVQALSIKINNAILSMQDWVNTTLTNYYDIAQVDAKLALLYSQMLTSDSTLLFGINDAVQSSKEYVNTSLENYYDIAHVDEKLASLFSQMLASNSTHLADVVRLDLSIALLNTKFNNIDSTLTAEIRKIYSIYDSEIARIDSTYSSGIADVDSKVSDAQKRIAQLDSTTTKNISLLHNQLDSAKVNLTKAYTEAINNAIETNNGVIDTKIAKEIATVNTRIDNEINAINLKIASFEGRISALEERVNELSKQLGIRFSDNDISCSPGDIVSIDYTIINGTDSTTVYALPSNGYKVKIIPATKLTGSIKVTVPNPIEDCSILIFVNNADRTVLKSLNFISGTMSISADVVMVDADGDDVSVDLSTDLQYTVKVPEAATWVHYNNITTKSVMRNETINFTIDENNTPNIRSAIVQLVNGSGLTIGSVTIRQSANVMQANEIWYKTSNNHIIELPRPYAFGANIVSNAYGKKGVITFDGPVTKVGPEAFQNCSTLTSISIPRGPNSIGERAFLNCSSLIEFSLPVTIKTIENDAFTAAFDGASIYLPDSLLFIGSGAFVQSNITNIYLPNTLKTIGSNAFYYSTLRHIELPNSLLKIEENAFSSSSIEEIVIPSSVIEVYTGAFSNCCKLKTAIISGPITALPRNLFFGCSNLESVIISNNVNMIYEYAFSGCIHLEEITINSAVNLSNNLFTGCDNLKVINYFGYPTGLDRTAVFGNTYIEGITLRVPKGMKQNFEDANWNDFNSIEEVDSIELPNPEAIDLGLSVKWSTFNVDATSIWDSGINFEWGETVTKADNSWDDYKWCNGSSSKLTKYGTVDNKTILDLEDDVAHVRWGGSWRMPTKAEWDELRNNCTWTWCNIGNPEAGGMAGYIVTSNIEGYTGRSIFLPASAYTVEYTTSQIDGYSVCYWSSSLYADNPVNAWGHFEGEWFQNSSYNYRNYGYSVRPVCQSEEWLASTTIELSETSKTLILDKSFSLNAVVKHNGEVFDAEVKWISDDVSVATVDANGNIQAKSKGTAHITASYSSLTAQCEIIVVNEECEIEHEYVDLGLGVKWATFNVGATSVDDYGDYYAWGETETKAEHYTNTNYKYYNSVDEVYTKYVINDKIGIIDNKVQLELEDDVANVKWGSEWRMPTSIECNALIDNCSWKRDTINGVPGFIGFSKIEGYTDKSIFLPSSGSSTNGSRGSGCYWSSSVYGSPPIRVTGFTFESYAKKPKMEQNMRYYGFTVRPVHQ